jgi:hypothetical protein
MKDDDWEEIRGFASLGEYQRFVRYIEGLVASGLASEIPAEPAYGVNEVYGGRWFVDKSTGKIWRLVKPDFPFRGVWEVIAQS